MAHGHRTVFTKQHHCKRLPDDVRAPDDHGIRPRQRHTRRLQKSDAACGRTRLQRRASAQQPPGVDRMKAVHVLFRCHRSRNPIRVHAAGQRKLHQNAADRGIRVQPCDFRKHRILRCRFGQAHRDRADSHPAARLLLVRHVNLAGRVLAHQHDRQRRNHAIGLSECAYARLHLGAHLACNFLSVNNPRSHSFSPVSPIASAALHFRPRLPLMKEAIPRLFAPRQSAPRRRRCRPTAPASPSTRAPRSPAF